MTELVSEITDDEGEKETPLKVFGVEGEKVVVQVIYDGCDEEDM